MKSRKKSSIPFISIQRTFECNIHNNLNNWTLKYNNEQEDEIRAGIVNGVYCVSISSIFDWDEINRNMNSIRLKDSHSKAVYRLRKRYRTLGKELFDTINIVL